MNALESDSPQEIEDFKADLSRKTPCRAEKRKCIEAEIVSKILYTLELGRDSSDSVCRVFHLATNLFLSLIGIWIY